MSTSAVFALVKDMDRLVATLPTISAAAGKAAADKLVGRARQLKDEPKLGRAEWKRLLVDKKVVHRLCTACMQAFDSQGLCGATAALLEVLALLVSKAATELSSSSSSSSSTLHAAMCDQLTSSGLLQQLPEVLQTSAWILGDLSKETSAQGSSNNSNSSGSRPRLLPQQGVFVSMAPHLIIADAVRTISSPLCVEWTPKTMKMLAPVAAAAAEMFMSCVRAVDHHLWHQQQPSQFTLQGLYPVLQAAELCFGQLVVPVGTSCQTKNSALNEAARQQQALLSSSGYLQCLSYCTLVYSINSMPDLQQLAAANRAAGMSAAALLRADLQAQAETLLEQADSLQSILHTSQQQLAALLGLRPKTVLWAVVAAATYPATDGNSVPIIKTSTYMSAAVNAQCQLCGSLESCVTGLQQLQMQDQQQQLEHEQSILRWVACTVIQWAADLPPSQQPCKEVGYLAVHAAVRAVLACQPVDKALQGVRGSSSLAAPQGQSDPQWTDCLLMSAVKLLTATCQHTQQLLSSASGGNNNNSSSSSNSSSLGTVSEADANSASSRAELPSLLACFVGTVELQCLLLFGQGPWVDSTSTAAAAKLVQQCFREACDSLQPTPLPAAPAMQPGLAMVWLEALEGFTRCMAGVAAIHPDHIGGENVQALVLVAALCVDSRSPLLGAVAAAGPGSREWKQLYSLMASLLKAGRWCGVNATPDRNPDGGTACASAMLGATRGAAACAIIALQLAAADCCPVDYTTTLPSLVVFGRCCTLWAGQLQQQMPSLLQQRAAAATSSSSNPDAPLPGANGVSPVLGSNVCSSDFVPTTELQVSIPHLQKWLGDAGVSAQLADAGYHDAPKQLQEQLEELLAACSTAADCREPGSLTALVEKLQAIGEGVSVLAVGLMCNNPACSNISGPTERELVSGRSCKCGGCRIARYCGKSCQRVHWKQHKLVCRALAAAAAAAAAGGAASSPSAAPVD